MKLPSSLSVSFSVTASYPANSPINAPIRPSPRAVEKKGGNIPYLKIGVISLKKKRIKAIIISSYVVCVSVDDDGLIMFCVVDFIGETK